MDLLGRHTLLSLALVLVASVATAEIYRWTDAQGGEHFTTRLEDVPAAQRGAARARAAGRNNLNFHATHPPAQRAPARSRDVGSDPSDPTARPSHACNALRKQVKKLLEVVRYHERKVAAHERAADDITRSEISRRKSEIRAEKSQAWLDAAEVELEAFRDRKRREGVDPGCYR